MLPAAQVLPGGAAGAGALVSLAGLGGLVGAPVGGFGVDRVGARATAVASGLVGGTAGVIGACATFLYAVRQGVRDIQSGRKRVVVVGNSEAPVVPEVIEGYRTMGALAEVPGSRCRASRYSYSY